MEACEFRRKLADGAEKGLGVVSLDVRNPRVCKVLPAQDLDSAVWNVCLSRPPRELTSGLSSQKSYQSQKDLRDAALQGYYGCKQTTPTLSSLKLHGLFVSHSSGAVLDVLQVSPGIKALNQLP